MTDAIDLTPEQRSTLRALLRRFIPGVAVWAYGSRVKWTARPNSDLDLVAFTTPAQRSQVAELKEALAESNLPFPVDLHVWDEVPERFREIIRKEYVVLQEAKQLGSGSGSLGIAGESPIEYDLRWPVISLAEIAIKIGSGATPKGGADDYLPSRARFALVRSQNVFDRRFDYDGLAFISDEQADGLRGVILQPDDILLNITGDGITFGRACMVPKDVLPACVNQHVSIIRLDPQRADAGYVLAFLTHPDVKSYIESFNAGGSRRAVTKGHIESFRLPLPPLPEQRAIAHILGTLDDKIELNRRMNETLEAMARALFKSWFVDFDPVFAKAEGRDPGLPKALADLFPDSFEDSDLGEIPNGWEVRGLDEIARFLNGLALQKYPPKDGSSLPVIKISQLRTGETAGADVATADLNPDYVVEDGDVLFSWSGSLECVLWTGGRGALNQHLFKVTSDEFPKWFYYLWIHQHLADFRHIAAGKATTMGHIQRHHLSEAKVVIPTWDTLKAANDVLSPLVDKISVTRIESRTLADLRDTLLPKLISGELCVPAWQDVAELADDAVQKVAP